MLDRPPVHDPVYLDYNATTPLDPAVLEAMLPFLTHHFGNASSGHGYGYQAHLAIDEARSRVASLLGASADEIVFTAGGSESDNLAIKGVVFRRGVKPAHVVASAVDHPAVLASLNYLRQRFGVEYTLLPVDEYGLTTPDELARAIRPETVLVTVIHANNEVGTIQPVHELAEVAHARGVLMHTDAAQSAGKIPVNVDRLGVDLLSLAAHKMYGPKGIGALYVRRGTRLDALVHGGSQEHSLRAGTENVASIVGLGEAARLAAEKLPSEGPRLAALRDQLHQLISGRIPNTVMNGHPMLRVPNTLNVSLPGVVGAIVLLESPEVAASTGSACHTSNPEPSAILTAMGFSYERAIGALRLTLGRWTTEEDVVRAAGAIVRGYQRVSGNRVATPA
jgi:cysteine desulfurase